MHGSMSDDDDMLMSSTIHAGVYVPNRFVDTPDHLMCTGCGGLPWALFIIGVDCELHTAQCVLFYSSSHSPWLLQWWNHGERVSA